MKLISVHTTIFALCSYFIDATFHFSSSSTDITPGLNFYSVNNTNPHLDDYYGYPILIPSALQSLQVNARIIDGIAEVTMVQHFLTPEIFPDYFLPFEAAYQIPLDELAAVTEFKAEIDDRIISAVVKEKEEARAEYEEALENGQNAYLVEQVRADIFIIRAGNLPEGKLVKITLVYVTYLDTIDEDTVRFVFPTDVAPRYSPANSTEIPIPGNQVLMENGVDIQLNISMATEITNITCTHEMEVYSLESSSSSAAVNITDEDPQERDLVIYITTESAHEPQVYIESSPQYNTTALMISIVPDIPQNLLNTDMKTEFIFIIDRSGSMHGEKIEQLRQAMSIIIDLLPPDSLFNIIGFGSDFLPLFDEGSRLISNLDAKTTAQAYIDSIEADYLGTEILSPLKYVLGGDEIPLLSTYDRVVFVVTDGQVSNTDETIEYVQQHQENGRVFSLGIGEHVSALLVRGLARAGKGTAEFVDGTGFEDIKDAVERQILVASTPALSNVIIHLGTLDESSFLQAPFVPPNLLNGKRFLIFFIVDGMDNIPETVSVTSNLLGTDSTINYNINFTSFLDMSIQSNGLDGNLIHKMACRSMIRDLEEGGSKFHYEDSLESEIKTEIIRLGLLYQIASSQTSFVAVDNYGWNASSTSDEDTKEFESYGFIASAVDVYYVADVYYPDVPLTWFQIVFSFLLRIWTIIKQIFLKQIFLI